MPVDLPPPARSGPPAGDDAQPAPGPRRPDARIDPDDGPACDGRPETLLASTLLLMSAYARSGGGPRLAAIVLRHLEMLAAREDLAGVIAATADQAADHWVQLARPAAATPPVPTPRHPWRRAGVLLRLVRD